MCVGGVRKHWIDVGVGVVSEKREVKISRRNGIKESWRRVGWRQKQMET